MRETYTYDGFTGTKKQWSERLGISYASMLLRFKNHYPDRLEKVFSEIYLTPGANMPNETCKEAKKRSDESLKKQYEYMRLINKRKYLKNELAKTQAEINNNLEEWGKL